MLKKLVLGVYQENCYILSNDDTKEAVIIDPGEDAKRIAKYLEDKELKIVAILITHGHIDHIAGVDYLTTRYKDIPVYIHEEDEIYLTQPKYNLSRNFVYTKKVNTFKDEDELYFANYTFKVLHLPGHTPGCSMFLVKEKDIIFSGDVLFNGGIGRYDFPLSSHADTNNTIEKIKLLNPKYTFFPGHGPHSTIAYELINNPFLAA